MGLSVTKYGRPFGLPGEQSGVERGHWPVPLSWQQNGTEQRVWTHIVYVFEE